MDQLAQATGEQARSGGQRRLGEVLVALGHIDDAQLGQLLQYQERCIAKIKLQRASRKDAPANAKAVAPAPEQAAPVNARSGDADRAASLRGWLAGVLKHAAEMGGSDIHVHGDAPVAVRVRGQLVTPNPAPLAAAHAADVLRAVLDEHQRAEFEKAGQVDFAYVVEGVGRFRASVYRQHLGIDGVFRRLPGRPPTLDDLGLSRSLARFTAHPQGLVLFTGPTSCGKSLTMAALVHIINEERRDHILTIEDPVEVLHPSMRAVVNQRQVGRHTRSFTRALKAALREDPDIIVIGELRDQQTIALALSAAETGHLVFATMHTRGVVQTVDRLVGVFPPAQQSQVRTMISESLRGVVSQRLVPVTGGRGLVPALEILSATSAVGNLIRENRTYQLRDVIQTGAEHGMCTMDASLNALVANGTITRQEAIRQGADPRRLAA